MQRLQNHLRNTFLAGIFAVVPVAITAFIIFYVTDEASLLTEWLFHRRIPFVGVLVALGAVYLAGLITSSLLGKFFLRMLDAVLSRVPMLREAYKAWKHVLITPGGTEGIYSHVCLIPDESGQLRQLGFTRAVPVVEGGTLYCVYVPGAPNPVTGRLYFVPREKMQLLDVTTEEAFKFILSSGNYVPQQVGTASVPLSSSS
jgi:uncharacterized membrane protein